MTFFCPENETACHETCDGDRETESDFLMMNLKNGDYVSWQQTKRHTVTLKIDVTSHRAHHTYNINRT